MSDDVKVKFGGDFSDLSKGAKEAAEAAGVAMTSSFTSFTSKLSGSLISAIGVGSVATTLFNNILGKFEQFKELDTMSRKLGVSAEDLQRFGRIGKEAGVDMETMGRGIGFANKFIGAAQLGVEANRAALEKLGFTQQQINSGSVKATDLILALAKSYEETKSETLIAAQAQSVFGRTGLEMVGVIKQGTEALKEQMAVMAKYSNVEVKRGAEVQKRIESGKKFFEYHFGGKQAATIGYLTEAVSVNEMLQKAGVNLGFLGLGNEGELAEDKGRMKEITEDMLSEAKKAGMSLESLSDILHDKSVEILRTSGESNFYEQLSGAIYNAAMKQEQAPKPKETLETIPPEPVKALVTSSLQSIGGGDVTSVFAGIDYQKTTAEQMTLANQYLQMIATSNGQFVAAIKATPINAAK